PGAINFWTNENKRTSMNGLDDLRREAENAQALRYVDLNRILGEAEGSERAFLARIALLPRLDVASWQDLKEVVLQGLDDVPEDDLKDNGTLSHELFPTFGHDSRHSAARRWFAVHKPSFVRKTSEELILELAARAISMTHLGLPSLQALAAP